MSDITLSGEDISEILNLEGSQQQLAVTGALPKTDKVIQLSSQSMLAYQS